MNETIVRRNIIRNKLSAGGYDMMNVESSKDMERLREVCSEKESELNVNYVTVSDMSKLLGVKPIEIYKMIKVNVVPAILLENRILIPTSWYTGISA